MNMYSDTSAMVPINYGLHMGCLSSFNGPFNLNISQVSGILTERRVLISHCILSWNIIKEECGFSSTGTPPTATTKRKIKAYLSGGRGKTPTIRYKTDMPEDQLQEFDPST